MAVRWAMAAFVTVVGVPVWCGSSSARAADGGAAGGGCTAEAAFVEAARGLEVAMAARDGRGAPLRAEAEAIALRAPDHSRPWREQLGAEEWARLEAVARELQALSVQQTVDARRARDLRLLARVSAMARAVGEGRVEDTEGAAARAMGSVLAAARYVPAGQDVAHSADGGPGCFIGAALSAWSVQAQGQLLEVARAAEDRFGGVSKHYGVVTPAEAGRVGTDEAARYQEEVERLARPAQRLRTMIADIAVIAALDGVSALIRERVSSATSEQLESDADGVVFAGADARRRFLIDLWRSVDRLYPYDWFVEAPNRPRMDGAPDAGLGR